ncbi:Exocyst complex component S3A [Trifolium repens]|nr:Exocyst complex component S3A [Trifolium repens]
MSKLVPQLTFLSFMNLESREFANELRASTKASRNPAVWLEGSTGSGQNVNATDISTVSDAFAKMLTIFIPLLVDESSFFAHFMCFEVPTLVPPEQLERLFQFDRRIEDLIFTVAPEEIPF